MNKQDIISALEQEREDLYKKIQSLDLTILTLRQSASLPNGNYIEDSPKSHTAPNGTNIGDKYKSYHAAKSNKDKVVAILKAESRFLHMREITAIAQKLDNKIDPDKLKGQIQQAVYGLKNMEKSPLTTVIVGTSNQNVFWGSVNWLTKDGDVKPEHMYDEGQLTAAKGDLIEI
jgi:hypothetical protein